jgi:hypothetical protein
VNPTELERLIAEHAFLRAILDDAYRAMKFNDPLLVDGRPRGGASVAHGAATMRVAACIRVIRAAWEEEHGQ